MSPWDPRRQGIRSLDLTWMPDELELAPDWVREEVTRAPLEFKNWLSTQYPAGVVPADDKKIRKGRRGRRPRR